MTEALIAFFERLITQFTWRRLLFVLGLIFVIIAGLAFYEFYTGHFRLGRIDQESALLDKLAAQSKAINSQNPEDLSDIHRALTDDLRHYVMAKQSSFPIPSWILKFLAAIVPWLLLALIIRIASSPDGFRSAFGGILIVAIPVAFVGALIPDFKSPWFNYVAYPALAVILIVIPLLLLQRWRTQVPKNVFQRADIDESVSTLPHN